MQLGKIVYKNEPRRYMGPKRARIPRGTIVKLTAVVNGRMAIFEWNGEKFNCPIRLLWRIKGFHTINKNEGICEVCGKTFKIDPLFPKVDFICDKCLISCVKEEDDENEAKKQSNRH
jgi:hypothetical protein